jgi:hypothetical protein
MQTAQSLPGFTLWCRHQHDLEAKVKEWVRCIEASHYFPYGSDKLPIDTTAEGPSWNERQQAEVRERITKAVTDLKTKGNWPDGITTRFDRLTNQGISGSSLYKHKDLWHPRFMVTTAEETGTDIPPAPPTSQREALGTETPTQSSQAYWENGCNSLQGNRLTPIETDEKNGAGCNNTPVPVSPVPPQVRQQIQQAIAAAQTERKVQQRSYIDDYLDQLQLNFETETARWANSEDPIFEAEAKLRQKPKDDEL